MIIPLLRGLLALGLLALSPVLQADPAMSPNEGPFRTISEGADPQLMLEGHDPVAYFTQNAAVKGDPSIVLEHLGVSYRFASSSFQYRCARARFSSVSISKWSLAFCPPNT